MEALDRALAPRYLRNVRAVVCPKAFIERTYELFTRVVSTSRNLTKVHAQAEVIERLEPLLGAKLDDLGIYGTIPSILHLKRWMKQCPMVRKLTLSGAILQRQEFLQLLPCCNGITYLALEAYSHDGMVHFTNF